MQCLLEGQKFSVVLSSHFSLWQLIQRRPSCHEGKQISAFNKYGLYCTCPKHSVPFYLSSGYIFFNCLTKCLLKKMCTPFAKFTNCCFFWNFEELAPIERMHHRQPCSMATTQMSCTSCNGAALTGPTITVQLSLYVHHGLHLCDLHGRKE